MSDLRERLEAESFGTGTWEEPSYTKAIAVEDVPAVVAEWLRAEAAEIRRHPRPAMATPAKTEILALAVEHHALGLESLADALTQKEPDTDG